MGNVLAKFLGPTRKDALVVDMHRVVNKEGVEVRKKAILIRPPPPKPPPWKKQPSAREAALAEEKRRVADWSVFRKSELVAQLPFGTTVRLVGDVKETLGGEKFCRVEAGDVAGWAVLSGSEAVSDPDNEWGWRYEHYQNFIADTAVVVDVATATWTWRRGCEEDTVTDAPAKVLATPPNTNSSSDRAWCVSLLALLRLQAKVHFEKMNEPEEADAECGIYAAS